MYCMEFNLSCTIKKLFLYYLEVLYRKVNPLAL
jgi:hypothetical protein